MTVALDGLCVGGCRKNFLFNLRARQRPPAAILLARSKDDAKSKGMVSWFKSEAHLSYAPIISWREVTFGALVMCWRKRCSQTLLTGWHVPSPQVDVRVNLFLKSPVDI